MTGVSKYVKVCCEEEDFSVSPSGREQLCARGVCDYVLRKSF